MAIKLDGTYGFTFPDGTASVPSITGATSGNTSGIFFPAANTVAIASSGSERMRIDSSGNLGVGTNSPLQKLHISGATNGASGVSIQSTGASGRRFTIYSDSAGGLGFFDDTAGSERMRIDSSGNVGIGTSSPNARLDIRAASANVKVNIGNNGADNNGALLSFTGSSTTKNWYISNQYNVSGALEFTQTTASGGNAISSTPAMILDSSGNLLVGITSSTSKLAVVATSQVAQYMRTSDTNDMMFLVGNKGGNSSTAFYVMPIRAGSTETFVGGIRYSGSVVEYNTSSDYRLKENVQQLTGGLDRIMRLKPSTYTWKEQKVAGEGFLAHELQEVIPAAASGEKDAVNEDGSIKPQSVDYSKIVVHLVAAIQELKAELDIAKTEIISLKG